MQKLLGEFSDSGVIPAIVLFSSDTALTGDELTFIEGIGDSIASVDGVSDGISPAIPSDDGKAVEFVVPIEEDGAGDTVEALRALLVDKTPVGLSHYVTGPAGFTADLVEAFAGIDGILLLVALAAVFLILLIVYRSPLLPVIVLGTSVFALSASILAVWWLAKAGAVALNGQVQGILFILVIGAATDYSLLYVSRYREALRDHEKRWDATWAAPKSSVEPILASGGTVIVALLCLLFSDLNSNKALGPVGAIGVGLSVVASLTLLPALLLAFGRASFWPLRPKAGSAHPQIVGEGAKGLWATVGRFVTRRARPIWIVSVLLLLAASAGLLQLKADRHASLRQCGQCPDLPRGRPDRRRRQGHAPGDAGGCC